MMTTVTVRGRTFAVNCKSGSQLRFILNHYDRQSDAQLDRNAREYQQENDDGKWRATESVDAA